MDNTTIELLAIDGDLEDETLLMELARQVLYRPLYCMKDKVQKAVIVSQNAD